MLTGISKEKALQTEENYSNFQLGKTRRDIVYEMLEQGMGAREISAKTGIAYGTVYYYTREKRLQKQSEKKGEKEKRFNDDRHLCRTCRWRNPVSKGCDYAIEHESRPCDVEECTVYEKGKPRKAKG